MAKSYFAILEVSSTATLDEIRSAYRRLAKTFHPDRYGGGSEPFQKIQEAYSVIGNPARRKAYEKSLTNVRMRRTRKPASGPGPEPLIPERGPVDMGKISPVRSFETFSPSFDEIFDWLWNNYAAISRSKSDRIQNLTLEVPLTREQAASGGNATVMVPARSVCPICWGEGSIGYYECHRCAGEGAISGEIPVSIAFPPNLCHDHSVVVSLDRFGIRNLHFTVLFRPMD